MKTTQAGHDASITVGTEWNPPLACLGQERARVYGQGGWKAWWRVGAIQLILGLVLWRGGLVGWGSESLELLNVSYDPTRELFDAYNQQFQVYYEKSFGQKVRVVQSHGGSGKQARSVIEGLKADVVTLALAYDLEMIARHRLLLPDWETRLPNESSPYTSTIVFLVRQGNPRQIRDWPDLVRPGVQVIMPNPKTSGGARWIILAAWGSVTLGQGGNEQAALDYLSQLYRHVPVLDAGARGATTTFAQKRIGDAYLTWENEAKLVLREFGEAQFAVVYPSISILAQPCVAVVDRNVDRRGPRVRKAAEEYLRYLYDERIQELIAEKGYRPVHAGVRARYRQRYPEIRLFTLKEVAGSWMEAQKKFFAEDGVFDQISRP